MDNAFDVAKMFMELAAKYNGQFDFQIRDDKIVFSVYDEELVKTMRNLYALLGPA
jgi:hypothetical protein